jgi:hypothetical protein
MLFPHPYFYLRLFKTRSSSFRSSLTAGTGLGGRRAGRRRLSSDIKSGGLDFEDGRPPTAELGLDIGAKETAAQPNMILPDSGVSAQLIEMEQQQAALKMKQEELLRRQQQEQVNDERYVHEGNQVIFLQSQASMPLYRLL